jgi:PAS domain S-box-containing protein
MNAGRARRSGTGLGHAAARSMAAAVRAFGTAYRTSRRQKPCPPTAGLPFRLNPQQEEEVFPMAEKTARLRPIDDDAPLATADSPLAAAEKARRESEEKYRMIIENIEDGYYEVDLAGNFTFFNTAMARITGFRPPELLGLNNRRIMDPYQAKRVFDVFNTVYRTGLATKAFDWQLIRKDGAGCIVEVSVSLKKSPDGQPAGFMGIARDVTHRKLMEQALRDSEEKYRTIIESIEDGYYEVDLAGNFTFFNDAMTRITGYPRKELLGKNNRDIMDAYNAKRVFTLFNKVYRTGLAARAFDWELIRKDGTRCFVEVSVSPKRNISGQATGFMGIARDVTERKQAEKTLMAREQELEIKTRNLEEVNTALKVLLRQREEDKRELEETVVTNLNDTVKPYLERIKTRINDRRVTENLAVMEENLDSITSPFSYRLASRYMSLTASEIEIANLVKQGKTTKEIASLMNVSCKTVEVHRLNIRNKMGIKNRRTSLRAQLLSIR